MAPAAAGSKAAATPAQTADAPGPVEGKLTISQWPLYIDPGKNGTIAQFEGDTGVDVNYVEDINDNQAFFGKIQPAARARASRAGRSLITVSDWLAAQMYDLGYLQKLDYSKLPNVKKNLIPALRHPDRGPAARLHRPLAGGDDGPDRPHGPGARTSTRSATCSTRSTRARSTMLTEMRDTVPMTLKCMGIDPEKATEDAVAGRGRQDQGSRRLRADPRASPATTTSRTSLNGNVDFVLGWSGDAVQLQADNPNIKFVMPKEGCMLWSTSMEIPVGRPEPGRPPRPG